jgi:aminoglycoside phosphotransferase (APT) family kinase protein/NAD(P)-dependent dehydrogenase (short-subunit alcohol dehydrogenase family)/alkylation response protein AidB-like acyl-CoA dehydrogenase
VIGTMFYVMDCVEGACCGTSRCRACAGRARAIWDEMNRVIALLHTIDYQALGLEDFGTAGNYIERQIARWTKQYQASELEKIEAMDNLIAWLPKNIPPATNDRSCTATTASTTLIFHPSEPSMLAVLDWELSTLGDPLADFSYHCMSWHIPRDKFRGIEGSPRGARHSDRARVHRMYLQRTGRKGVSRVDWDFYMAYNLFRIAAILQGIAKRVVDGTAASEHARDAGAPRAAAGRARLAQVEKILKELQERRWTSSISASARNCRNAARLHGRAHLPERAQVLRARARRQALGAGADHRGAEAQGAEGRPVEPVPAALQARAGGPVEPGLRAAVRDHGPRALVDRKCSIARRRHRQHGDHRALRHRRAKEQWLDPLLEGKIRSAFLMTEPAVASSDATNIQMHIKREGEEYVINGRKWWSSGAGDPRCKIYIVMGKTNPDHASRHSQQSMVLGAGGHQGHLDPAPLCVFGYDDAPHGHMEIELKDVRVPASSILLGEGRGFEIAQGRPRAGPHPPLHAPHRPGRGRAREDVQARERARRLRPHGRRAGRYARAHRRGAHHDRCAALHGAERRLEDGHGRQQDARKRIAMIKVMAPNMACQVIDWAMQVHGGGGVCQDFGPCVRVRARSARCASPTARTKCTATRSPRGARRADLDRRIDEIEKARLMDLKGKVCVVTGAASGIGRAAAQRFAAEGAAGVVVADLNADGLKPVADELKGLAVACDVSSEESIRELVRQAEERYGRIDVYFSNAGSSRAAARDPDQEWERNWKIHCMAHVWAARAVVERMVARGGGYFLITASAAGLLNIVESASYGVTKHGAVAFAEWLAIAYGRKGLRVSCLCPQAVDHRMYKGGGGSAGVDGALTVEQVCDEIVKVMHEEKFLILPHPQVLEYMRAKTRTTTAGSAACRRFFSSIIASSPRG